MRRLAVFAGDFTAEAASLVAADDEIAVSDVVCSLANLVTKSLVTLEAGGAIAHHRLHETTRVYALEKLVESGEFVQVARRHADYYRGLFERAEIELETLPASASLAGSGGGGQKVLHLCGEIGRFCPRASRRPSGRRGAVCPG